MFPGNNNSLQRNYFISPEQAIENQRWLVRQVAAFDEANRFGLENYMAMKNELNRKIMEGERARQQMQHLQRVTAARTIAGPSVPSAGSVQYTAASNIANQQLNALPPATVVNGSDAIMMNAQNAYAANTVPPSASSSTGPIISPREQNSDSGAYVAQQGSSSFPRAQAAFNYDANPRNQQGGQPQQVPSRTVNWSMQEFARLSGLGNTSNPALYTPYQQQTNRPINTGSGKSSSRPQGAQLSPNTQHAPSNRLPETSQSSTSGLQRGSSSAGSNYQIPRPTSSSSLAGALGEGSYAQAEGSATQAISEASKDRVQGPSPFPLPLTKGGAYQPFQSKSNTTPIPAVLAAMPDDQFAEAQAELSNIIRSQPVVAQGMRLNVRDPLSARKEEVSADEIRRNPNMENAAYGFPSTSTVHPPKAAQFAQSIPSTIPSASSPSVLINPYTQASSSTPARTTAQQIYVSRSSFAGSTSNPARSINTASTFPSVADAISSNYTKSVFDSNSSRNPRDPDRATQNLIDISGLDGDTRFTTPPPDKNRPAAPLTPASANKKTLAKDILRALNKIPEKRKASTPESSASDAGMEPPAKRQEIDNLLVDPPAMLSDLFTMPTDLPVATDISETARIEEVHETVAEAEEVTNELTETGDSIADVVFEEVHLEPVVSEVINVPDSLPSRSAAESRASSEAAAEVDTALQPLEDSSVPLFLPSPDSRPVTPGPASLGGAGSGRKTREVASTYHRSRHGLKPRMEVYVEVPTLTAAQRELYYLRGTKDETVPVKILPSSVLREGESEVAASNDTNEKAQDDNRLRLAHETNAITEANAIAASRLRSRRCLWSDCFHVANCANSLKSHVLEHVELIQEKDTIFSCWWGDCIRRFNKREALAQHLQNHVRKSIFCSFRGCESQFTSPLELLAHVESMHPTGKLRTSVEPFKPPVQTCPPLQTMFAYRTINLPIKMAPLTKERRAKLGPWVAKNCFGPVNLVVRNQLQRRRSGVSEPKVLGNWQDKYDFVEPWGATYPAHCTDLESSKATEDIESGLVLLPDRAGPQGPLDEHLLTSRVDRVKASDSREYTIKADNDMEGAEAELSMVKMEDLSIDVHRQPTVIGVSPQPEQVGFQDFLGVGEPQLIEPGTA